VLATAAADVGNLRFYQRCGFRMTRVVHDLFTPEAGYPPRMEIDGIPLRCGSNASPERTAQRRARHLIGRRT
jgi:hypothetical protein